MLIKDLKRGRRAESNERRTRSKTSIIHYGKNLPEDVWYEIFRRLPLKSKFKFKLVSKLWHSLLSMTRMRFDSFNPWTYICRRDDLPGYDLCLSIAFGGMNSISDDHGHDVDRYFSFKFLENESTKLNLLASSNGLVLCSSTSSVTNYYVCNPLTKTYVSLIPPPNNSTEHCVFLSGIISESSSSSSSSELVSKCTYEVVLIPEFTKELTRFDIEIYSSNTGKWRKFRVSCSQKVTMTSNPFTSSNVVSGCNGVMYWIGGQNRIIAYYPNKKKNGGYHCRLIDLPAEEKRLDDKYRCLGESEGSITYSESQNGQLSIWVLEDDYIDRRSVRWCLVHKIRSNDMLIEEDGWLKERLALSKVTVNLEPLAFNPIDSNVVILGYRSVAIAAYSYNIRTRRLKELSRQQSDLYLTYTKKSFMLTPWPTKV